MSSRRNDRRSRRAGDLTNRIKQVEDALQGLAYGDDAQIRRARQAMLDKGEDGWTEPGLTVRIEELAGPPVSTRSAPLPGLA